MMRFFTLELVLVCLMSLSTMHVTIAQITPQDWLRVHNTPRSQVGVGSMTWSNRVATYAQNYANRMAPTCRLVHSRGPYGENLARSRRNVTAIAAVRLWVNEKPDYHYNTNTYNPGKQCGHYTQVVWRNSVCLGCARVRCNNGGTYAICSYDPPGNWVGQWPYSQDI